MVKQKLKFFETDRFKKLQKHWYDKARFKDLEKFEHGDLVLRVKDFKPNHDKRYYNNPHWYKSKEEYYYLCTQAFAKDQIDDQRDHFILLWNSNGLKRTEIKQRLEEIGHFVHRQTIRFVIRRFEVKWKIRSWSKQQLTSNRIRVL